MISHLKVIPIFGGGGRQDGDVPRSRLVCLCADKDVVADI